MRPLGATKSMDRYETPLATRYASDEINKIFSKKNKYLTWRRLWIALANAQKELGVNISNKQIDEMEKNIENIDFAKVATYEKKFRHEVMAHIAAFADVAPSAKSIIHLGATSSYVMDNTDLLQIKSALSIIQEKCILLLSKLNHVALKHKGTKCLAYTHFQPAQATTFGKRICLYMQDLLFDCRDIEAYLNSFPFLGVKGATGTQSSFLALFENDASKVNKLDELLSNKMGFDKSFTIASQTYPRKQDARLQSLLSGIGITLHKMATDIRLLSHTKEVQEPFQKEQVGSSAMAYKRNPILSERICSIARYLISLKENADYTASLQWLERSLDDSANRRMSIAESFLAADSILNLACFVIDGLHVHEKVMAKHLREKLAFLITEDLVIACVKKGQDREDIHLRIKNHAKKIQDDINNGNDTENLLDLIGKDKAIDLSIDEINQIIDFCNFTGLSEEQTIHFLKEEIDPLLESKLVNKYQEPNIEI